MKEKTSPRKPRPYFPVLPADSELLTTCPRCGAKIELWSEDDETACIFCGQKIFEREATNH